MTNLVLYPYSEDVEKNLLEIYINKCLLHYPGPANCVKNQTRCWINYEGISGNSAFKIIAKTYFFKNQYEFLLKPVIVMLAAPLVWNKESISCNIRFLMYDCVFPVT